MPGSVIASGMIQWSTSISVIASSAEQNAAYARNASPAP